MDKKFENSTKMIDWVIRIITIVALTMIWLGSQGEDKFYPKLSGESLSSRLDRIESEMINIRNANRNLLQGLSRIEGQLKNERNSKDNSRSHN